MSNNNQNKVEQTGVHFKFGNSNYGYGYPKIINIDVEPGVDTVKFDASDASVYGLFSISLSECIKQFPDVKTLIIGKRAFDAEISNFMFPNVEKVISHSSRFVGRDGCLFKDNGSTEKKKRLTLLNTFCKKPGVEIDMQDVNAIKDYALEGCKTVDFINADEISSISSASFSGSALKLTKPYINGVSSFKNILLDVDLSESKIDLPKEITCLGCRISSDFIFKEVVIHSNNSFSAMTVFSNVMQCETLFFDFDGFIDTKQLRSVNSKYYKISDCNKLYSVHDGILYDKKMETLIRCPINIDVDVIIPEGVKYIQDNAFSFCKIRTVAISDSMKDIGGGAFYGCAQLEDITFGSGIEFIGNGNDIDVFFNCTSLTKVDIPSNIKMIGNRAFFGCSNLSSVELHDGLEVIGDSAFDNCSIKKITLPKTVRKLHSSCLQFINCIQISGVVPFGFWDATLNQYNGGQVELNGYSIVELTDGKNKLFLPRSMDSIHKEKLVHDFSYRTLAEAVIEQDYINKTHDFTPNTELKQDIAIKIYQCSNDKKIYTYLRRAASSISKRFLKNNEEEKLVEFLNLEVMTIPAMNNIFESVKKAGMTSATAYILNAINNEGGNKQTFRL